jgi:hypothetical protein
MKRMKRLIATYACALAVLVWTCAPVRAETFGTLAHDQDWTLQVTNSTNDYGAVRVYYVGRALDVIDVFTVPASTAQGNSVVERTLPAPGKRVKQVVIEVDPPFGEGGCQFRINNGAQSAIIGSYRLVLAVV